jgi:hypothetical protein
MQLYLTLSFVFFLVAGLTGNLSTLPQTVKIVKPGVELSTELPPEFKAELQKDPDAEAQIKASMEALQKGGNRRTLGAAGAARHRCRGGLRTAALDRADAPDQRGLLPLGALAPASGSAKGHCTAPSNSDQSP